MNMARRGEVHSFYIPVMGTGFTVDTPLKVAKYGISSVISLVDDNLIETMRRYWCSVYHEPYLPINTDDLDHRAHRITAYLNLLQRLIAQQMTELREGEFKEGSELTKYFELLPSSHPTVQQYRAMLAETDPKRRAEMQTSLKNSLISGSIDVNIMTKLDVAHQKNGEILPYRYNDAAQALRGFAESDLESTLVLSAGFNPHLYGYLAEFSDFLPDETGYIKKKICLKVSDFRSAEVQGKYLAKRGIWVSEYRIESPLNCGGHTFLNDGQLIGPILEEFRKRRDDLAAELNTIYAGALAERKRNLTAPLKIMVTAQGGIGTSDEHEFLLQYYHLDAVGWGSPFLLVPEATNVDDETLHALIAAKDDEVYLSGSSPVGVPFWNFKNSPSEQQRLANIKCGTPGSACPSGYIRFNTEFTKVPVCMASRQYQRLKLQAIDADPKISSEQKELLREQTLARSCICYDLAGGALKRYHLSEKVPTAICPGPNIVYFKRLASLKEMVEHIYGRCSLLASRQRAHMFLQELKLQINQVIRDLAASSKGLPSRSSKKLLEVKKNLLQGIEYYRNLAQTTLTKQREEFLARLQELKLQVEAMALA